jgi:hypothetical protein
MVLKHMIIVCTDSARAQRSFFLEHFQSAFPLECFAGKGASSFSSLHYFLVITSNRLQFARILISSDIFWSSE